jgi:hypothetical protein
MAATRHEITTGRARAASRSSFQSCFTRLTQSLHGSVVAPVRLAERDYLMGK